MPQPHALPSIAPALGLAVIDTNVVLDLLLFEDPRSRVLRRALDSYHLTWVATETMLEELSQVLSRPFATARGPTALQTLAQARQMCRLVGSPGPSDAPAPRCSDPDDQMFIDLAVNCGCRWLFTRDLALLRLRRAALTRGVTVLRPADWLGTMPANLNTIGAQATQNIT